MSTEAFGGSPERPSADVAAVVHGTCERLYGAETEFVDHLVATLPPLVPTLVPDPRRVREVAQMLARAVLWAGLTPDGVDVVEATLAGVGADAVRFGLPPTAYHGVGHALLRAARETFAGDWGSEQSSAWVAWFSWVGGLLAAGALQFTGPAALPGAQASAPATPQGGLPQTGGGWRIFG